MNIIIVGSEITALYMTLKLMSEHKIILINEFEKFGGIMFGDIFGPFYLYRNDYTIELMEKLQVKYDVRSLNQLVHYNIGNGPKITTVDYSIVDKKIQEFYYYKTKRNNINDGSYKDDSNCMGDAGSIKEILIFDKFEFLGKIVQKILSSRNVTIINGKINDLNIVKKEIKINLIDNFNQIFNYDKLLYTSNVYNLNETIKLEIPQKIYNTIYYKLFREINVKLMDLSENYVTNSVYKIYTNCDQRISWDLCYISDKSSIKRITNIGNGRFLVEMIGDKTNYKDIDVLNKMVRDYLQHLFKKDIKIYANTNVIDIPGNIGENNFYENIVLKADGKDFHLFGRYATLRNREMCHNTMENFHDRFKFI